LLYRKRLLPLMRCFVIFASLSLFACVLWLADSAKTARLEEASRASENLTAALAQHARDTFRIIDTTLLGLVERLEVDGQDAQLMPRLQRLMQQRVEELPGLQGIFIVDRHGNPLVSSYGSLALISAAERAYFRWHLEHNSKNLHIGSPMLGQASGQWVIPVSHRLNDQNGQFAGVVMASLRVDYFQQIYQSLGIGYQGVISLSLADGTLLVRQPSVSAGRVDLSSSSLPVQSRGSFSANEQGGERLYSYQRLSRYPLTIMAALSQSGVLENWHTEMLLQIASALVLITLLNLLGFYLIRLLKNELATRAALQQARDRLAQQSLQLEKLAMQDELTGLANRRHFMTRLHEEALRACRHRQVLSLAMMDVDFFKQYNDLNGHAEGDHCLRQVADVIRKASKRPGDLAARYGGEEFCLLLASATDSQGAVKVAEDIRKTLEKLAIPHRSSPLAVLTISIGVHSLYPQRGDVQSAIETLLQCADIALYQAKALGRNRIVVYQDEQ